MQRESSSENDRKSRTFWVRSGNRPVSIIGAITAFQNEGAATQLPWWSGFASVID